MIAIRFFRNNFISVPSIESVNIMNTHSDAKLLSNAVNTVKMPNRLLLQVRELLCAFT